MTVLVVAVTVGTWPVRLRLPAPGVTVSGPYATVGTWPARLRDPVPGVTVSGPYATVGA